METVAQTDAVNSIPDATILRQAAPDSDPEESLEWLEALDGVLGCGDFEHARRRGVKVNTPLNTPYCNTIARRKEPVYPGDLELEKKFLSNLSTFLAPAGAADCGSVLRSDQTRTDSSARVYRPVDSLEARGR